MGIKHFNIQWAKDYSSYSRCILLISSRNFLVLLYWIVDYPYKRGRLWRHNQEEDAELPCPRWLRWSPERQRRITPNLRSKTNEDWFLAATVRLPSSAPIPPCSSAVTSAPLHVLSCLCRDGKGTRQRCAGGPAGRCRLRHRWWAWSQQPQGCTGRGLSGRPGIHKSSTSPPFYWVWLELINESGVLLLKERQTFLTHCVGNYFPYRIHGGEQTQHFRHNLNKKPGFWKLEVTGCLYSISEQRFRHRSGSAAAFVLDLITPLQ